jgi:hypothetical protein
MACTDAAEERVTRSSIRGFASGVLCESAPRVYNEGLTQLELELSRIMQNNCKKGIRRCKEDFICETGIITVLQSVARIGPVKDEKT